MEKDNTLLSYVAQRLTRDLEDAATHALSFILTRSTSALMTLSDVMGDDRGPLPVAKTQPWLADAHGAIPDLACFDDDGDLVALIESKFWAQLTHHQPVTYWQSLPKDNPAVLLFLAPATRIDEGSLWDELVVRLRDSGHQLDIKRDSGNLVTAHSDVDQRRLILASWELLLEAMAKRAAKDGDVRARFEIAELQGLAVSTIEGDRPTRAANLKQSVAEAVIHVERSGWASTGGLSTGEGLGYYARYLRLAGATAGLRIDYEVQKQEPDKHLWLWFYRDPEACVSLEAVRERISGSNEPALELRWEGIASPIALPVAADRQATLDAIVAELKRFARIIDPSGPTYQKTH